MDRPLSAPSMDRSTSLATADASNLQRSMTANPMWHSTSQESNEYTFCSESSIRRHSDLQPIAETTAYCNNNNLTEWSPIDYVNTCIEPTTSSSFPSSLPINPQQLHVPLTPTLQWGSSSDNSTAPSTPSSALTTPVTQSSSLMSRQSSCTSQFLDSASMLRIQSDSSCMLPILSEDGDFSLPFNVESKTISNCVDSSLFPSSFTGSSSESFLSSAQSFPASAQAFAFSDNDKSYLAEDMRRSTSTTYSESSASDASVSSTCSRQSRREREVNAQASRKIAPKAIENYDETESLPSNAQMKRIRSEDGSSKTVGVITKTPYVRPQHPKIMCQFCQERPEGFRGTHELDRHIARAHASRRKGYICVDYSADKKFLANCKHCRNKKVYGAYYNAAAHLRRAHFHPRKRGRKGKNDEKRGGIGGGDDPPMDYLKMHWIQEVEVDNKPVPSSPKDNASDDEEKRVSDSGANETATDYLKMHWMPEGEVKNKPLSSSPNDSVWDNEIPAPIDTSYDNTYEIDSYATQQQPMSSSMTPQVSIDPSQYVDYGMSMHASEPMMYDANAFAAYDTNLAAPNDMSSFEFDAYMS